MTGYPRLAEAALYRRNWYFSNINGLLKEDIKEQRIHERRQMRTRHPMEESGDGRHRCHQHGRKHSVYLDIQHYNQRFVLFFLLSVNLKS